MPPGGIEELIVLLDSCTDIGGSGFISQGRVTRVDVAVDLQGLTCNDAIVSTQRKQKHGTYSDRQGFPETVYLGTPRSHRVVAYTKPDKKTGSKGIRLECRLKPKCLGEQIASLPNPLAKVSILPVTALNTLQLGFPPQLLADSIRVRGLKHALSVFPTQTRNAIKKALASSASLLPNPEELWAGWPDALMKVGLGKELGVALQNAVPKAA
jgi:hypothetical protein